MVNLLALDDPEMTRSITELNNILRAVRQSTVAKVATGFELGNLLSENELQQSACKLRPNRPMSRTALVEQPSAATFWSQMRNGSSQVIATSRRFPKSERQDDN
jgi:hypothetical protein